MLNVTVNVTTVSIVKPTITIYIYHISVIHFWNFVKKYFTYAFKCHNSQFLGICHC